MVDPINGTPGSDYLDGTSGDDVINGFGGDDVLAGNSGADRLNGGSGSDFLFGDAGDDTLNGGPGSDYLIGGLGTDTLNGGAGFDRVSLNFGQVSAGVSFHLNPGHTIVTDSFGTKTLISIEAADIVGSNYADSIIGGRGDDYILGAGGDDRLSGGPGNDFISGDAGDDSLNGGAGIDGTQINFFDASAGVTFELTSRTAVDSPEGQDTLVGFEWADIYGSSYADTITGGSGNDSIFGNDGDDTLRGAGGQDYLDGDGGADTFDYDAVADSQAGAADIIDAFQTGDRIDLSDIDANTSPGAAHDQAFTFIGSADFSSVAGELRTFVDTENRTHVLGDVNGDAVADLDILVISEAALQPSDFIL